MKPLSVSGGLNNECWEEGIRNRTNRSTFKSKEIGNKETVYILMGTYTEWSLLFKKSQGGFFHLKKGGSRL